MTSPVSPTASALLLLGLLAETPLHPGTGQTTGVVDLPIQRERHTAFPVIPSTSLKGCLRDLARRRWQDQRDVADVFGPDIQQEDKAYAGAIGVSDARLLAFPVRSLREVFVWVTCPYVLDRLSRDLHRAGLAADWLELEQPGDGQAITAHDALGGLLVLEDLSLQGQVRPEWGAVARAIADRLLPEGVTHAFTRDRMATRLVLVSDNDFRWFAEHATQVTARISLNDNKTTTGGRGNLWYEETLPADTVMYALIRAEPPRRDGSAIAGGPGVRDRLTDLLAGAGAYLQTGGNETVGQGWLAVRVADAE